MKGSVLLVDDDKITREIFKRHLEHEGFLVAEVEDREGLQRRLQNDPPHFIVLDAAFPGGVRDIQAELLTRRIPIFLIGDQHVSDEERLAGLKAGAMDYLRKPISLDELSLRIRNIVASVTDNWDPIINAYDKSPQQSNLSVNSQFSIEKIIKGFWVCKTQKQLDRTLDHRTLLRILSGIPKNPSECLLTYVMSLDRIRRNLDHLSEDALVLEKIQEAALHLAYEYFQAIGFILSYVEWEENVNWNFNPHHPHEKTIAKLQKENKFLYAVAKSIMKRSKPNANDYKEIFSDN